MPASEFSKIKQYRENYASSQKVLSDAQNRLRERTERERRAQEQFHAIQQQLESLESETTTMVSLDRSPSTILVQSLGFKLEIEMANSIQSHTGRRSQHSE